MNRKEAREYAMQTLFQMEAQNELKTSSLERFIGEKKLNGQESYIKSLITNILDNIHKVDETINECSNGWSTLRMPKTDLAIIRVAVGEILFIDDVPTAVSINEAVNLGNLYGTVQSPKFINAVLGNIERKSN